MARVTATSPHVDQPFGWRVAEIEMVPEDGVTGEINIPVFTLPAGTVVLSAAMVCTLAEAGATTSAVDMELGVGGTDILSGLDTGALGTTENTITEAVLGGVNFSLATAEAIINAEVTITGSATTLPHFVFALLCGRTQY